MSKIINKSIDTIKQGVDSLKNIKKEKHEYKENLARIKALPEDYRYVFEKIEKYLWSFSGGNGYDMVLLQADLLELFETSAANGKHVFEVTGEDVAAFCDELLRNAETYTEKIREKFNNDIIKKVEKRKTSS